MIRLLAIDIDGTLINSRGVIPADNRRALADAVAAGIEVALVTGRSHHFTLPIARTLDLPLTLIVNNGAMVKDLTGTTHLRRLLDRDIARRIIDATADYEDSIALVFDRAEEGQIVFHRMDWSHQNRKRYFDRNRSFIRRSEGPLASALVEDPVQVMFNGAVAPMRQLVTTLREAAGPDACTIAVTEYADRDFCMVDVNGPGCSKGTTLERWAMARGVSREQVLAAGDNFNDAEMLEWAGTAVVMGNAAPELKARLPHAHLALTHDEAGLARALEQLLA